MSQRLGCAHFQPREQVGSCACPRREEHARGQRGEAQKQEAPGGWALEAQAHGVDLMPSVAEATEGSLEANTQSSSPSCEITDRCVGNFREKPAKPRGVSLQARLSMSPVGQTSSRILLAFLTGHRRLQNSSALPVPAPLPTPASRRLGALRARQPRGGRAPADCQEPYVMRTVRQQDC